MPHRTGIGRGRSASAATDRPTVGIVAAYAAAVIAFAYALLSLYWAVGGRGLVGTIGGFVEQMARRGGVAVVLLVDPPVALGFSLEKRRPTSGHG